MHPPSTKSPNRAMIHFVVPSSNTTFMFPNGLLSFPIFFLDLSPLILVPNKFVAQQISSIYAPSLTVPMIIPYGSRMNLSHQRSSIKFSIDLNSCLISIIRPNRLKQVRRATAIRRHPRSRAQLRISETDHARERRENLRRHLYSSFGISCLVNVLRM